MDIVLIKQSLADMHSSLPLKSVSVRDECGGLSGTCDLLADNRISGLVYGAFAFSACHPHPGALKLPTSRGCRPRYPKKVLYQSVKPLLRSSLPHESPPANRMSLLLGS